MEVKLPDAFFTPDSRSGFQPSGLSEEILQGKSDAASLSLARAVNSGSKTEPEIDEEEYEILVALMEQTATLLSRFDRELKYEVREDAGLVQIQVIDARDGRVVRKIPADEVVQFIANLREQFDDHMDVLA
jgi:uncharacterized FlaG/YvyC family protein